MAGAVGSTGAMLTSARKAAGGCGPLAGSAAVTASTLVTVAPLVGRPILSAATCWPFRALASKRTVLQAVSASAAPATASRRKAVEGGVDTGDS
ncbi:hypothetical protein D3C72_1528680 [compost metagenome]